MEIIIAMCLAFLLGAYVRAPFKLRNKEKADAQSAAGEKDEEQARLERQLSNLLNYGRERD